MLRENWEYTLRVDTGKVETHKPASSPGLSQRPRTLRHGAIIIGVAGTSPPRPEREAAQSSSRNRAVGQHNKPRGGVILAQQGEPIDLDWAVAVTAGQAAPQICEHRLLAVGRKCAGERHVE